MLVEQYPHALYLCNDTEKSERNEQGFWINRPEPQYRFIGIGRLELNGEGGAEEKTADGTQYLKNGCFYTQFKEVIKRGDKVIISTEKVAQNENSVKITDFGSVLLSGYVKGVQKGQLNTKIYIYDNI